MRADQREGGGVREGGMGEARARRVGWEQGMWIEGRWEVVRGARYEGLVLEALSDPDIHRTMLLQSRIEQIFLQSVPV